MRISALVFAYVPAGFGLLLISVRLARRIRSAILRAVIHGGVFAVWFSPAIIASKGGSQIVPVWLVFFYLLRTLLSDRRIYTDTFWFSRWWWWDIFVTDIKVLALFWGAGAAVSLCFVIVRGKLRQT